MLTLEQILKCLGFDRETHNAATVAAAISAVKEINQELHKRNRTTTRNTDAVDAVGFAVRALASASPDTLVGCNVVLPGHVARDNGSGSSWSHTFLSPDAASFYSQRAANESVTRFAEAHRQFETQYMQEPPEPDEPVTVPTRRTPSQSPNVAARQAVETQLERQVAQVTEPQHADQENRLRRAAEGLLGTLGGLGLRQRTTANDLRHRTRARQPVGYLAEGDAAGAPVYVNENNQIYTDSPGVIPDEHGNVRVRLSTTMALSSGMREILTPIVAPAIPGHTTTTLNPDTFLPETRAVMQPPAPPPEPPAEPAPTLAIAPPLPADGKRYIIRRKPKAE